MAAEGEAQVQKLLDGGFTGQEVSAYQADKTAKLQAAGFTPNEITDYWGQNKPDGGVAPLMEHNVKQNWSPADAAQASDPASYFAAGLNMSTSSLAQHAPGVVLPSNVPLYGKILAGVGQTLGDIPTMAAGFWAGAGQGAKVGAAVGAAIPGAGETGTSEVAGAALGGVVGGVMAGTAVSEATRETLMSGYEHGGLTSWQDFVGRAAPITYNTAKASIASGAGALVGGGVAGGFLALGATPTVAAVANAAAFAATSTTASAAMEGKVPNADDFIAGAALALGTHAVGETVGATRRFVLNKTGEAMAQGQRDTYAKTGVPPWEAARAASQNPGVAQETMSRDVNGEINPRTFMDAKEPEPETFDAKPLEVEVTGLPPDKDVGLHLAAIRTLEGSENAAKLQTRLSGKTVTPDNVVSPAGAVGRYQIMPATARQYMGSNFDVNTLTDPKVNEAVATKVLQDLTSRYKLPDGSPDNEAIYIAYNAGPGRANRFLANGRDPSILPIETQKYLTRADRGGLINMQEGDFEDKPGTGLTRIGPPAGGGGGGEPPEGGPPGPAAPGEEHNSAGMTDEELNESLSSIIGEPDRESFLSRAKSMADTAYDDVISELGPAKRFDEALGLDKSEQVNLEDLFRSTYASPERAGYFIREGVIDNPYNFTESSKDSLIGAYKMSAAAGGTEAEFTNYRLGARALDLEARGVQSGYTPEQLQDAAELVSRKRATYEAAGQMANRSKAGVLRYMAKAGLYSSKGVETMIAQNPNHIPFNRVFEGETLASRGAGRGMQARQNIKAMEGSQRKIVEPVHAEIEAIHKSIANADRNVALQAVVGLDKRILDQMGVKRAPDADQVKLDETPQVPAKVKPESTEVAERSNVAPGGEASPEGTMKTRDKLLNQNRGTEFTVFVDGHPVKYTVDDPNWARLIQGSPKLVVPIVGKAFQFMSALERTGITVLPDYLARMMLRLQMSTSVLEPYGGVPGVNFMVGMYHVLGQTDAFHEFVRSGGMGAGMMDMDVRYIRRDVERVFTQTHALTGVLNYVQHPIEASRLMMERTEAMGRMGMYQRQRAAGRGELKSAMGARRGYLDFAEKAASNVMNAWSAITPFLKLGLLGKEQIARQMTKDGVGTVMRGLGYVALPTIALFYIRALTDKDKPDNEKWENQPQWIKDHYWGVPMPGGMPYMKLAKPYEVGMTFGTQIENFMRFLSGHDPKAFAALGQNAIEMLAPNFLPPGIKPVLENMTNFSFGNGRPLVPHSLDDVSNHMQYTQNTSPTAVALAHLLGNTKTNLLEVSPIVLQNYVSGWAGTVGTQALRALDAPQRPYNPHELADNPFVGSFFIRTQGTLQPMEDFYDAYKQAKTAKADADMAKRRLNTTEMNETMGQPLAYTRLDNVDKALGSMQSVIQSVTTNKSMSADEKRQLIDKTTNDMLQLAQVGTSIVNSVKNPTPSQDPTQAPVMATGPVAAPAPAAPAQAAPARRSAPSPAQSFVNGPARGPNGTLALPNG